MSGNGSNPLAIAGQQLRYLDQRQRVLAQNIANADTPGYRPRDLKPFADYLSQAGAGSSVPMARTNPLHLVSAQAGRAPLDRAESEASPTGNAVSLEHQALKVAETDQAHSLALGLHRSWVGMFRSALGRG